MPKDRNVTFEILAKYLKSENIILDLDELKLQLLSHPSYPSLHSITGVLDHFSIKNLALEVPINLKTLNQLPKSFISIILEKEKKELVLVHQLSKKIEIVYGDLKKKEVITDKFFNIWSGIVVVIENDGSEKTNSLHKIDSFSNAVYMLTILFILSIFFLFNPSIFQASHFMLSLLGIGVSLLLVKHELGFQSKTVDKFCTGKSKITNCDAVLFSNGASISKNFKLSDISLIYFSGLAVLWILLSTFFNNYGIIVLFSLLVLPITFYSVFYQYKVVRKWCPLCLTTVAVLWLQVIAIFVIKNPLQNINIDITSSFIFIFSFLLVTSSWLFVKPLLKKQIELNKLKIDFYKFKRNFTLFNAVYSKGPLFNTNIDSIKEITLGNKKAPFHILLVTNPSCFYCKEAHDDMENLLKKSNELKVTIRFNVPLDNKNLSNKVAQRLLEIYNAESNENCEKALNEAYHKDVDLEKWLNKWGVVKNKEFKYLLKMQRDWCTANSLHFTPVLILNGKQFPKEYNRNELVYFLDDLTEQLGIKIQKEEIILI